MQHKTKKIWLIALLSLLIAALFAASFTYARYYKETGVTGGKYDDTIEFVGANKYIVYTPEELVAAIENGYSYIEIADGAEEPFVITDGVTDVTANLVLDINGHSLVRNSRNPLIDVQENVSVVIVYDSKASGSFYNPVGSLLQASGGTLTIATGNFTSGPKAEDYQTAVGRTKEVTVYYRESRGAEDYTQTSTLPMPAPSENMYFADGTFENAPFNQFIQDDTFLIYTEETVETPEDATVNVDFSPLCDVASCDFYYYYEKSTEGSGEDKTTTYAVIYGYHDVMKGAEQQITKTGFNEPEDAVINSGDAVIWPYAAVRMTEGEAFIRGGTYTNQFGTAQSYGIYARGGSLSVQGENTSFTSVADGVCICCTTEGGSAPALHIENGSFTSYNGDTVQISGGEMNVKAGKFTKTGCKKATESDRLNNQTAIISLQGGTLNVNGTKSGDDHSVTMKAGGDANGGTLENVFGIRAVGGGKIETKGVSFDIYGDYSAGVLSYDGTINLGSDTLINVVQSVNTTVLTSAGVSSEASETQQEHPVNLKGNVTINSNGLGITARGVVNVTGKGVAVTTTRGTGIYVNKGEFNVETGASITVKSTVLSGYSWATPPKSGTTDTSNNEPNIYNGVYVQGGSLISKGTLTVTFDGLENDNSGDYLSQQIKSYAVRVEQAASGKDTKVTIASGSITNSVGGGVYVGGGTVELGDESTKAGPTVKTTGKLLYASVKAETSGWGPWQETTYSWEGWKHAVGTSSWPYMLNKSGGHAVEVSGGSLTVHGGSYSAQQGNGILIRNTSGSQISNQVTINSGSFTGYNGGYYISYDNNYGYSGTPLGGDRMVGPAASYGLNVMGHDLNVTINGGSFGETGETGNSAASFFGTSGGVKADVNVYGGTFNATNADAISIFRYIDIMFDGTAISSNIGGTAAVASLSVQDDLLYTNDPYRGSTITLNNGTFTGTAYGVWYACGYDRLSISGNATIKGVAGVQVASAPVVENGINISGGTIEGSTDGIYYGSRAAVNDGLVITGGQIKGTNRYGFYFNQNPWSDENGVATNNVAITGGTFIGGSSAFWANTNDDRGQNAAEQIKTTDIFKSHTSEQIGWCYDDEDRVIAYRRGSYPYTYYHVGGDNSISLNGLMSASAGINSFYLNNFKTIIIKNVKVTDQDVLEDNWDIHRKIYS